MKPEITYDEYEPQFSPSVQEILDIKGAEQFMAKHGVDFYASPKNVDLLKGFVESRGIPYSLRNLEAAFYSLKADGLFESEPAPVEQPQVEIQDEAPEDSMAARQLRQEKSDKSRAEESRLRTLAGEIGQPLSRDLKREYQQSLVKERGATDMSQGQARAEVSLEFPDLDVRSVEFNRKVSEKVNRQ